METSRTSNPTSDKPVKNIHFKNLEQMNTTENNKLIAEFMGVKVFGDAPPLTIIHKDGQSAISELYYEELWDWLMPVVGKLSDQCEEPEELDDLRMCLLCNDIEGAYSEVVSLIENL
jgi:hypothetical protein